MAAISVADVIREAEGGKEYARFRGWGKQAGEADLRIISQRLKMEQQPQVLVNLLKVFSARALPDFDVRLIELCRHSEEVVRRRAFCALELNTHPLIREFALTELQKGVQDGSVVGLFINNYCPGDEQRILEAMELSADAGGLHWLLMDVCKVLEKNPTADPSRLGVVCYALNPCECCRFRSARLLSNQQAASQWLKEECLYDSNEKFRGLFAKLES